MDFLHTAIILFGVSFAFLINFFTSGSFMISFWGLTVTLPTFVLGIVYLVGYLRKRGKPVCGK